MPLEEIFNYYIFAVKTLFENQFYWLGVLVVFFSIFLGFYYIFRK